MNVIDDFFEKINKLPMLPKVVQEVTQLLNRDDDLDFSELASTINHDQILAAKVLRMSNAAHFGCSRSIKSIDEAVNIVGVNNLKTLVIASGVTAAFNEIPGFDLKRFWVHSLVTAGVARQLASDLKLDSETAYISGLMHSVGQLPLHMVFPAAGARVDEVCKGRSVLERKNVEQSMFGLDHAQIGEALAEKWNFPEEILRVIRYYATPLEAEACVLAPIVYTAAHIAFDLEFGKEATYIAETLEPDVAKQLGLTDVDALTETIEACRALVPEAKSYI